MDKLAEWQRRLLSIVGQAMLPHGFEQRTKGQSLVKKCPFGHATFHLTFINHSLDFDVTVDVGIRFDGVEDLVNKEKPFLTKAEKALTCTLGCELGTYRDGGQKRWTVASEDDVPVVANAIVGTLEETGLAYITRFSSLERALEVLSGDGPNSWLHAPFHDARAKRAVSLALQVRGRESARQLASVKSTFLEEIDDPGLAAFQTFVNKLGLG